MHRLYWRRVLSSHRYVSNGSSRLSTTAVPSRLPMKQHLNNFLFLTFCSAAESYPISTVKPQSSLSWPGRDVNNFCRLSSQLMYQAAFLLFAIQSSAELGRWEQLLDVRLLFNFLSVELQEEPAFAHYKQLTVLIALILQPPDLYTVRIKAVRIRWIPDA
jgi:hypothetical protein